MYLMIAQYRYRYRKSGKIYWLIPAIGISAKSHIGASLETYTNTRLLT